MNSVFIHIPKTAGGYIVRTLGFNRYWMPRHKKVFKQKGFVNFGHQDYSNLVARGYVKKQFDETAFKFAFCRNPFDRVVSHYFWTRKRHPDVLDPSITFFDFTKMLNNEPVLDRISKKIGGGETWYRPQNRAIRGVDLDFIGRFESLQKDLDYIAKKLNIERSYSPRIRASKHAPYQEYYNKESIEFVLNYYKEDFEKFGYSKCLT